MIEHPFPYITELKNQTKIETIADLLFLQDITFSIIPWKAKPYFDSIINRFETFYTRCKSMEIGGWCGLNAEFLRILLTGYNIRCSAHNYGLVNHQFTHVVVKAEIDGMTFLLDPYFNRTYMYRDEFILQYYDILRFLNEKKLDRITSVFGTNKKPVIEDDGGIVYKTGPEFEKLIMSGFDAMGINKVMQDVFNATDLKLLILLKIPTPPKEIQV